MPRTENFTPSAILSALSLTPEKPSALAARLGVSRATVHRKLKTLLSEKLVVVVGAGPASAYRLPTPRDALEYARSEAHPRAQVRLTVGGATAQAIQEGLELYSRIGIGQLEQIAEMARYRNFGPTPEYTQETLNEVAALVGHLKLRLLGLSPGASFGAYGPRVHPKVQWAWAAQQAIRHRLAWDRRPLGGHGVSHNEPLRRDAAAGLFVYSDSPDEQGIPARYALEMPSDFLPLFTESLSFSLRLWAGDVGSVLEMLKERTLVPETRLLPDDVTLAECTEIAGRLTTLLAKQWPLDQNLKLDAQGVRMLQVVKALQGHEAGNARTVVSNGDEPDVAVEGVGSSPWAMDVDDMPQGTMLNFHKGEYRVIAPSQSDGMLVIVASSHSLQTAIQLAKNHVAGGAIRAGGF